MTTRAAWRAWLAKNHDRASEIWLVYDKKATGRPRVAYAEAVEEALCFGWIDGIAKPIDEERYAQRFTPRREKSKWSALNRRRFARLVREGKMTPAGRARRPLRSVPASRSPAAVVGDTVPVYVQKALSANRAARDFFESLAPSYRRLYVGWIDSAKKEETKQRRLAEAIGRLARRQKPGLK